MQIGVKTAQLLRERIKPHFLRREKADVFNTNEETPEEPEEVDEDKASVVGPSYFLI